MNYFNKEAEAVLNELEVTATEGLTSEKVEGSRLKHGENKLLEEKPKSIFRVFLEQFADLLVIILIIAAAISMFTGNLDSSIVIFVVITMNAILGTAQHVKAQKSLDSLKAMSAPTARVIRDG